MLLQFLHEVWLESRRDELSRRAAAIAYYTVFTLPASILVVLSIAGSTLRSTSVVETEFFRTLEQYIGADTATFLQSIILHNQQVHHEWSWVGIVGIVVLLLAATGVFRELHKAIGRIVDAPLRGKKFMRFVRVYAMSVLLLLLTAGVLLVSVIAGAVLSAMSARVESVVQLPLPLLSIGNSILTYAMMWLLLFMLYSFLPEKRYPIRISGLCALIASSIMVSGTVLVSYYLSYSAFGKAYGVAAGVLVVLFWIYWGAYIFLFGVEMMDIANTLEQARLKQPSWFLRVLRIVR